MNRNLFKALAVFLFLCGSTGFAAHSSAAGLAFPTQELPLAQASTAGILASTSFSWVDITDSGEPIPLEDWENDDEGQAPVPLPWPFPWFGESYSTVYIDANGNVGFEDWTVDTWTADPRLPSPGQPNNRVAVFYEDMAGPATKACGGTEGAVYTYYDAAGERFIVEYHRWCSWEDFQLNTFEVILYEDGHLIVQYLDIPSSPSNLKNGKPPGESPAGVESPDGASGLWYYGRIQDGAAWLYQPYQSVGKNLLYFPFLQ